MSAIGHDPARDALPYEVDSPRMRMDADFTLTVTDPTGMPVLVLRMDAALRRISSCALDDAFLTRLLVVTSVAAGTVEGECVRADAAAQAGKPMLQEGGEA